VSGEEAEDAWVDFKSKLYRFDHDAGEWKERGVGQTRLLRHKVTDRVRLLFRQEKTLKVRANHIVMPGTKLAPHAGSDKAVVWSAADFSEEEQKLEMFCLRFASPERAAEFTAKFEEAVAHNAKVLGEAAGGAVEGEGEGEGEGGEGGDASAAAKEDSSAAAPAASASASGADQLAGEVAAKAKVGEDEAESAGAAKADE
jgi:Ran-binding protein 1